MSEMKRKESEWGFEETLANAPNGVQGKQIQIDENTVIFHVTHPAHWDQQKLDKMLHWAKGLRKVLPENAFLLVTVKDIGLDIKRPPLPKEVKIMFQDCQINSIGDVREKIIDEFDRLHNKDDMISMSVEFSGCNIIFDETIQEKKK